MDTPNFANVARYLRLAAFMWLAYLVVLAAMGFVTARVPNYLPWFSITQALLILPVLILGYWERAANWLGRAFLPFVIMLMSLLPILLNHLAVRLGPASPFNSAEGVTLRLIPLLLLSIGLLAWRFRWRDVILFCVLVVVLDFAILNVNSYLPLPEPPRAPQPPPPAPQFLGRFNLSDSLVAGSMAALVQFCVLLVVGTFIALLMLRLRAQHASLERANAQLANYASALEHLAVSRERNRVARELHDTLAHSLTGMTVQLETMKAYWDVDPRAAHELLNQVLDASRNGVQETRRALKALRASPLDDLGLALAIRQLAESAAERAQLGLEISLPETLPNLKPEVEQSIYRIAQEAIENATHHANAKRVHVLLAEREKNLVLEIRDDGTGFDLAQDAPTGHYGLAGMKERAALIGARLEIFSHIGKGTRILLTV